MPPPNLQSRIVFQYDLSGRLKNSQHTGLGSSSELPATRLDYDYDLAGSRISLQTSQGDITYTYDEADRLRRIDSFGGAVYEFGFYSANRLTHISRPGSQSDLSYNTLGELISLRHDSLASGAIRTLAYERDAIGNKTKITDNSIEKLLGYDEHNQLTTATNPEAATGFQNETFAYDAIANRLSDQGGSYQYDSKKQRLEQDYRYFYFYDSNGNLTSKQAKGLTGEVTHYSYSSENQLIGFKMYLPGSNEPVKEAQYTYDVLGRRVQKRVIDHRAPLDPSKSFVRRYAYDGQNVLFEYDGNNQLLARYTHSLSEGDDVLGVDVTDAGVSAGLARANGSYQYLKDGLGSITDVTDSGGSRVQHFIYSAFGALLGIQDANAADVTSNPPLATSYGFTGRELDSESGLMYYRARYCDPSIGRFLQQDPHPGKLNLPASVVNSYVYSLNDPANRIDPSGRFSWLEKAIIAVAAIVVAVVAVVLAPFTAGGSAVLGGIIEGALIGALVGGAVGAAINVSVGRDWNDNIGEAIAIGGVAGGIAGGVTAGIFGSATSSGWGSTFKATGEKLANWILPHEGGGMFEPGLQKPFFDPICSVGTVATSVAGGILGGPVGFFGAGATVGEAIFWGCQAL